MEQARMLNIDILSIRKQDLLERLEHGVLYTPNVDHMVRLQKDRVFYEAYRQADWVVCDSVILHRLSRLLKHGIVESIPGATFFREFCDYHREDEGCKIFILGGKEGVPQRAMENINRRMGRRMVVGAYSPSFHFVEDEQENLELVRMVKESGTTVLVVCATSPKQEIWIAKYRRMLEEGHTEITEITEMNGRPSDSKLYENYTKCTVGAEKDKSVRLFMALGATVDFEAGTVTRCPLWIQRLGMEWFWRFCLEPRRLFKRYWVNDMKFFWYFGKQLVGAYKNPFG